MSSVGKSFSSEQDLINYMNGVSPSNRKIKSEKRIMKQTLEYKNKVYGFDGKDFFRRVVKPVNNELVYSWILLVPGSYEKSNIISAFKSRGISK